MKTHPPLTEEHEGFLDSMRHFVASEITKDLAARQSGW